MSDNIKPGDHIRCRTAYGTWFETVALSGPREDRASAFQGQHFVSVSVQPDGWDHPINWPVEDIEPCLSPVVGDPSEGGSHGASEH